MKVIGFSLLAALLAGPSLAGEQAPFEKSPPPPISEGRGAAAEELPTVNLRGLGPRRTLVLMNGVRLCPPPDGYPTGCYSTSPAANTPLTDETTTRPAAPALERGLQACDVSPYCTGGVGDGVATINLRGLGAERNLVLMNGVRQCDADSLMGGDPCGATKPGPPQGMPQAETP